MVKLLKGMAFFYILENILNTRNIRHVTLLICSGKLHRLEYKSLHTRFLLPRLLIPKVEGRYTSLSSMPCGYL